MEPLFPEAVSPFLGRGSATVVTAWSGNNGDGSSHHEGVPVNGLSRFQQPILSTGDNRSLPSAVGHPAPVPWRLGGRSRVVPGGKQPQRLKNLPVGTSSTHHIQRPSFPQQVEGRLPRWGTESGHLDRDNTLNFASSSMMVPRARAVDLNDAGFTICGGTCLGRAPSPGTRTPPEALMQPAFLTPGLALQSEEHFLELVVQQTPSGPVRNHEVGPQAVLVTPLGDGPVLVPMALSRLYKASEAFPMTHRCVEFGAEPGESFRGKLLRDAPAPLGHMLSHHH